jgi:hypothetical protein
LKRYFGEQISCFERLVFRINVSTQQGDAMKPFLFLASVTLLFVLTLSACGGTTPEGISNPEPSVSTPKSVNTPHSPAPEISVIEQESTDSSSPIPRELVEKAKKNLARYLNIAMDQIRVVESRTVDWPDTSLGCPQPETAYAQVITPGYYIVLEAGGQPYPYHTDLGEQVMLCLRSTSDSESELPLPVIPVNPDEIKDGQPWVPVD